MDGSEKTVKRLMTNQEATDKARKMGLDDSTTRFIASEFAIANDIEATTLIGEDGRIAYGQTWHAVYESLERAMGVRPSRVLDERVERVWDAFFEE